MAFALLLCAGTGRWAQFTCRFESPSHIVPEVLHVFQGSSGTSSDWLIEERGIKALFSTPLQARAGSAMVGDFPAALAWRRPSLRTPAGANLAAVAYEMTLAPTGAAMLLAAPDGAARKTRADGLCKLVF